METYFETGGTFPKNELLKLNRFTNTITAIGNTKEGEMVVPENPLSTKH